MLSQTIEYALRAMMHLAAAPPGAVVTGESIARHTKAPGGYMSKVMRDLAVAGLVHSQRGPNGGFKLSRPPGKISMLDVVNAVDPVRRIRKCPLGNPAHIKLCAVHQCVDDALATIEDTFGATTLAAILTTEIKPGQCRSLGVPTVRGKAV